MMTNMKKSCKKRAIVMAIMGMVALLPVECAQAAEKGSHNGPVFTDPIVGAWNCMIPPAGGAPGFNDIKNVHVGGTQSEIDNAAPPSQESPTRRIWTNTEPPQTFQKPLHVSCDATGNTLG